MGIRIDSGFPTYGSPHGGTQVVGTTNRNDIFNGLSYGQRQVNVALLDQSGNLHNPPITQTISVNYQSTTGGYQTPTGDTTTITSPGNGSVVTPNNDNLSVTTTYQSNGGGYQTPTWAYRIDSVSQPMVLHMVVLRLLVQPIERHIQRIVLWPKTGQCRPTRSE